MGQQRHRGLLPAAVFERGVQMTYDEKLHYLRSYRDIIAEIDRLSDEIDRWRSMAEKVTPSLSLAPGGGSGDRIASAVERIDACITKRQQEMEALCARRADIGASIDAVPDERLARLLRLRYIDGYTYEHIAVVMNYSYKQTRRLHAKAINVLECPIEKVV